MADSRIENQLREILGEQADLTGIPQSRIEELLQRIISEGGGSGGGGSDGGGENVMTIPVVQTGVDADGKPSYTINTPIDDIIEHMSNGGPAYFKMTQQNVAGSLIPALLYFNAPSDAHIFGGNKQVLGGSVMPTFAPESGYTVTYVTYSDDNGNKKVGLESITMELNTEVYVRKYTDPDKFDLYYKTPTMPDPEAIHTFSELMNIGVDVAYLAVYYIDNDTGVKLTGQSSVTGGNTLKFTFLDTNGSNLEQIIVTIAEGENDALNITEETKTYSAGSDVMYIPLSVNRNQETGQEEYSIDGTVREIYEHLANGGTAYFTIGSPGYGMLIPIELYMGNPSEGPYRVAGITFMDTDSSSKTLRMVCISAIEQNNTVNIQLSTKQTQSYTSIRVVRNTSDVIYIYNLDPLDQSDGRKYSVLMNYLSNVSFDSKIITYQDNRLGESNRPVIFGCTYIWDSETSCRLIFLDTSGSSLKKITITCSDDGNDNLVTSYAETTL